jgi:hypothetical protein
VDHDLGGDEAAGDPYGHQRPGHIAPAAKEALAYQASIAA